MKIKSSITKTANPNTLAVRLRTSCAARLLPLVLLLALPAMVQAQFIFTTNTDGSLNISHYTGSGGAVTIPSTNNGLPVTSIGNNAFSGTPGASQLTSVTIPNSIIKIGSYAFACINLTNITIPDSVTNIGDYAFYSCAHLANVTLGTNVTSIGVGAFLWCNSLTNATVGASVTSIGIQAFGNCSSLTAITVDASNPAYSSAAGVLFDKSTNTLIEYPGNKPGAYTIPDSVTNIGSYAFSYCTILTNITIPDSVAIIGTDAFSYCMGLTSVATGNRVTSIGSNTFYYCTGLRSVTIGNSVANIGASAFGECHNLTSVTIPDNVTNIGSSAFSYCSGLANVTIPESVTDIGSSAFSFCASLTGVYFKGNAPSLDWPYWYVFYPDHNATIYYLPGTTGWENFAGLTDHPTALWYLPNPLILNHSPSFGVQTNRFGFIISWATNISVVVEASTLTNPTWVPLQTNTLTGGWCYFSDPDWTNYPVRCYRLRSP